MIRILVELETPEHVHQFLDGAKDAVNIFAFSSPTSLLRQMGGIDAWFMSVTQTEAWPGVPGPPYTVSIVEPSNLDQQAGYPRYILRGMTLRDGDPDTSDFGMPILGQAIIAAVHGVNAQDTSRIRSLALSVYHSQFGLGAWKDIGRLLADGLGNR